MMDSVAQYNGFKNRIINGAMVIDQRNNGAAVSFNNTLTYMLDRWVCDSRGAAGNGVISFQRSSTAPTGFINSLSATLTTPRTSPAAGDVFAIYQKIEGYNIADFAWGTASAATITISFQVRSSITGTYSGAVSNSAQSRSYPFSFTINAANTFETKSVTIPGDTSGTWLTDNGVGLWLYFNLGCGSTYLGTANTWASAAYLGVTGSTNWATGATSSTFYVTGVQLEKGVTATAFDYLDYGRSLIQCQRYFETWENIGVVGGYTPAALGAAQSTSQSNHTYFFKVNKRVSPTFSYSALADLTVLYNGGVSISTLTALGQLYPNTNCSQLQATVSGTPFVAYQFSYVAAKNNTTTAKLSWDAEL
jgi:hypothetical protein